MLGGVEFEDQQVGDGEQQVGDGEYIDEQVLGKFGIVVFVQVVQIGYLVMVGVFEFDGVVFVVDVYLGIVIWVWYGQVDFIG